jgi:hypothetical protein
LSLGGLALIALLLAAGLGLAGSSLAATEDPQRFSRFVSWDRTDEGVTPCERSAYRMKMACTTDANEEYNIALANCENLSTFEERRDCQAEAVEVRKEESEECVDQRDARFEVCELLEEFRYDPDPLLDPANTFIDPNDVPDSEPPNPLHSLEAGLISVLRAGEEGEEVVVILNTDETREILGVECRIVAEVAVEEEEEEEEKGVAVEYEYTPIEITFDYFAQTTAGDIVYCGENTVEYEDAFPFTTDGTFIAGIESARSGYLLRADPYVGLAHRQEYALDEAEDYIVYEDLAATPPDELGGENEAFPCEGGCTQTRDGTPLEPEDIELKYYLPDTGFVLALPFELNDDAELEWTGEREELICAGDSLDILYAEACGIADPDELVETLCSYAGEWFCD